ncbi:hypothetical protein ALQ16_202679 [Pseudomonas syringae pv. actinidiae]|nr:hypothetical protein ALQ16_202679 [Pseudomonas syringae pv. actinidiae]
MHRDGLGAFKAVKCLGRALKVFWLAAIDLPAAAQAFIDQARLDAMSQQRLRGANASRARADDGNIVGAHVRRPGSRITA